MTLKRVNPSKASFRKFDSKTILSLLTGRRKLKDSGARIEYSCPLCVERFKQRT